MSDVPVATQDTRLCSWCEKSKPVSEFDARFINKPVKLKCAECREPQHREAEERRAEAARRWEERLRDPEWWRERRREERDKRQAEYDKRAQAWRQSLMARGYSEDEVSSIEWAHRRIEWSRRSWDELKQRYLALDPPFKPWPRIQTTQTTRRMVYQRQEGRCYYCGRALLPLEVWDRGEDGLTGVDRMESKQRNNRADSGIPELDHKIPVSRGGTNALDNLCYACKKCNQAKYVRTPEEFANMPNDAISQLDGMIEAIGRGIELEGRGYDGLAVGGPEGLRHTTPPWRSSAYRGDE